MVLVEYSRLLCRTISYRSSSTNSHCVPNEQLQLRVKQHDEGTSGAVLPDYHKCLTFSNSYVDGNCSLDSTP